MFVSDVEEEDAFCLYQAVEKNDRLFLTIAVIPLQFLQEALGRRDPAAFIVEDTSVHNLVPLD